MPELAPFAGQHTPSGTCDFYCGACCGRGQGAVIHTLGMALCSACHSVFVRDVELYKIERMAQLKEDAAFLLRGTLERALRRPCNEVVRCEASQTDGVVCPPDSCDREDGLR